MSIVPKLKKKTTRKSPPPPLFLVEGLERSRRESAEADAVLQQVAASPTPYERAHALHYALTRARAHSFYAHWSAGQVERAVWWLEKRWGVTPAPVSKSAGTLTAQQQYDLLHSDNAATVLLWQRGGKWQKITAKNQQVLAQYAGKSDVFLTPNEFNGWRKIKLLARLCACYVDIDKPDLTRADIDGRIAESALPAPSFIVHSGRGWHLYWRLESVSRQSLPQWQRVQDALINAYEGDPAARDCTRILRLVDTINSKNNAAVTGVVLDATPLSLDRLHERVAGNVPPTPAPVADISLARADRGQRPKITAASSIYSWWWLVYQDLCVIANSHPNGIPEGHRNNFLHIMAVAMSWFANPETLRDGLLDRAERWTVGLSDSELKAAVKCAVERAEMAARGDKIEYKGRQVDPRYHYRRSTIYGLLRPIISEVVAPELRAIISDETRTQRRAEREAARAPRDRVAEGRHRVGHSESLSARKPWEKEGISRATWYRRSK